MKRAIGLVLAAATAGILVSQSAWTAPGGVGFVDTARVFNSYSAAQKAQNQFRKEAEEYKQELAERQEKLEEARKAGKSNDELASMQKQFEKELLPMKKKVEQLDAQLSGKIKKDIESAIAQVAKQKGIQTVVDRQVILYGGTDLTGAVVNKLNN